MLSRLHQHMVKAAAFRDAGGAQVCGDWQRAHVQGLVAPLAAWGASRTYRASMVADRAHSRTQTACSIQWQESQVQRASVLRMPPRQMTHSSTPNRMPAIRPADIAVYPSASNTFTSAPMSTPVLADSASWTPLCSLPRILLLPLSHRLPSPAGPITLPMMAPVCPVPAACCPASGVRSLRGLASLPSFLSALLNAYPPRSRNALHGSDCRDQRAAELGSCKIGMHPNPAWCSCVVVCDAGTVAYCQEEHETDREKETGKDTHGEKWATCKSIRELHTARSGRPARV